MRVVDPVGYGIIGAGSAIARRAVIPAIEASELSFVAATASRSGGTGSYEDVIAHPEVEAVYIPLGNGQHREWTEAVALAGKHVLCEKPLAPTAVDALAMASACEKAGVLLAEAWMSPFGRRWSEAMTRAARGDIGEVREVRSRFCGNLRSDPARDHRWDPAQGGGALLDLGIYVLGPAVTLWGPEPEVIEASQQRSEGGVDVVTDYLIAWPGGRRAIGHASIVEPPEQELELGGTDGSILLTDHAFTGQPDDNPYVPMIDAMARDVRGLEPWPRPAAEAVALLELLERITAAAAAHEHP